MKYSILLPTRNRAPFLLNAIKSALALGHDDMEIVISNNHCTDESDEIIRGFTDARIRYVKPDSSLAMTHHWNWLLNQAKGDWVFFHCDDDALASSTLSRMDEAIAEFPDTAIFRLRKAKYYYKDSVNQETGNRLVVKQNDLHASYFVMDGLEALAKCYQTFAAFTPRPHNAFISRAHYQKVIDLTGKAFHGYTPDISGALLNAGLCGHYVTMSQPLQIWGHGAQSYGSGGRADPAKSIEFLKQFPEYHGQYDFTPYPRLNTIGNARYEAFALSAQQLESTIGPIEVNEEAFLKNIYEEVLTNEAAGHEGYSEYVPILRDRLARIRQEPTLAQRLSETTIGTLRSLRQRLRGKKPNDRVVFSQGESPYGSFSNINEAAAIVDQLIDDTAPASDTTERLSEEMRAAT